MIERLKENVVFFGLERLNFCFKKMVIFNGGVWIKLVKILWKNIDYFRGIIKDVNLYFLIWKSNDNYVNYVKS